MLGLDACCGSRCWPACHCGRSTRSQPSAASCAATSGRRRSCASSTAAGTGRSRAAVARTAQRRVGLEDHRHRRQPRLPGERQEAEPPLRVEAQRVHHCASAAVRPWPRRSGPVARTHRRRRPGRARRCRRRPAADRRTRSPRPGTAPRPRSTCRSRTRRRARREQDPGPGLAGCVRRHGPQRGRPAGQSASRQSGTAGPAATAPRREAGVDRHDRERGRITSPRRRVVLVDRRGRWLLACSQRLSDDRVPSAARTRAARAVRRRSWRSSRRWRAGGAAADAQHGPRSRRRRPGFHRMRGQRIGHPGPVGGQVAM